MASNTDPELSAPTYLHGKCTVQYINYDNTGVIGI